MFLPPIDLMLSGAEQDSTSVQILIPVPRERLRLLLSSPDLDDAGIETGGAGSGGPAKTARVAGEPDAAAEC